MPRSDASAAREAVRSRSQVKMSGRKGEADCVTGHPAVAQVTPALDFDYPEPELTMARMPEGGGYPARFPAEVADLMGVPKGGRGAIVHLCSGSVRGPLTFDLRCGPACCCATESGPAPQTDDQRCALATARRAARKVCAASGPACLADVRRLPIASESVRWIMADPPYSEAYADALWGMERAYPTPATILRESARVLVPGGKVALLHHLVPTMPAVDGEPLLERLGVWGVTTGPGYRIRALTIARRTEVAATLFGH